MRGSSGLRSRRPRESEPRPAGPGDLLAPRGSLVPAVDMPGMAGRPAGHQATVRVPVVPDVETPKNVLSAAMNWRLNPAPTFAWATGVHAPAVQPEMPFAS